MKQPRALTLLVWTVIAACVSAAALTIDERAFELQGDLVLTPPR